MNPEIESTHAKIIQSGAKFLGQAIYRCHRTQQPDMNSPDVEHDAELAATAAAGIPWPVEDNVVWPAVNGVEYPGWRRAA